MIMKTLRIGFWLALLAVGLLVCASASGQVIFGHPIDSGKNESSGGIFSSNEVWFTAEAPVSWANVNVSFLRLTNYPADWQNIYYYVETARIPDYQWWWIGGGTNSASQLWSEWFTDFDWNVKSNQNFWAFRLYALNWATNEPGWMPGDPLFRTNWYGTNVIGRTSVTNVPGDLLWVTNGICSAPTLATINSIVTDSSNNCIIAGLYQSTLDFGTGQLTNHGSYDFFVAKYNSSGVPVWSIGYGTNDDDQAYGVALDSSNNIVVCGYFTKVVDFGGIVLRSATNIFGTSVANVFIAKYSSSGALLWATNFGGTSGDYCYGVPAIDASDNAYIPIQLNSQNVVFGPSTLSSAGMGDIVLLKLNSNGEVVWARRRGGAYIDKPKYVALDSSGNPIIVGAWGGGDLGGGTESSGLFVAKYGATSGDYVWGHVVGPGNQFYIPKIANSVSINTNDDSVIVTGQIDTPVDFGHGNTPSAGVFLAKYNSTGSNVWAATFNTSTIRANPEDSGNAVCVDASGNITLTGRIQTGRFGNDWYFCDSYFVYQCDSNQSKIWFGNASGGTSKIGFAVTYDRTGHAIVGGGFTGTVTIGGKTITTPAIYRAPFVVKYY